MIPLREDYHVHFYDRAYRLVYTTQDEMINFNRDDVLGSPVYEFIPPGEAGPMISAMNRVFLTGEPFFHCYSYRNLSFLWLLIRVDDDIIAAHEIFDNPLRRDIGKRFLKTAAENFDHIIKERTG